MGNPKKVRWNVLAAIEYVCQKTKGKQLQYESSAKIEKCLEHLCSYFGGINKTQVIIFCGILDIDLSHLQRTSICKYFEMSAFSYLQHNKEIEDLDNRGLLNVEIESEGHKYSISKNILSCILRNQELIIEKYEYDSVSFVREISNIFGYNGGKSWRDKRNAADKFEAKNSTEFFIKTISKIIGDRLDRFCFYCICYYYTLGNDSSLERVFSTICDCSSTSRIDSMLSGKHQLLKFGLVDFVVKGNVIDSTLTLTEKGKHLFLGEKEYLYERKLDEKSLILPETIVSKKLFYSQNNQKQIDMLYLSVKKDNLITIQNGLKSKGMPTGICILLHGAPGTGKTESVYQIAKATNRQIVHVDISKTKSCWFGESEKKIEEIFTDYRNMCQKLKAYGKNDLPILLFNEADAILQKRTEFRGGGVEKTENAMQNILLENMEKFEGILIATTNLADNLDAAFERRFLFKIKFDNPSVEAKTAIWKSKLEWLPEYQARQLANEYNFSGGEIDNVVRKATMEEILTGSKVTINRLEELCSTEKLNNSSSHKMGFCM